MNPAAISFLQGEALANSVIASLGTRSKDAGKIYKCKADAIPKVDKTRFKNDLKRLLLEIATDYQRPVCHGAHVAAIEHVVKEMSCRHGSILLCGKFRIGVAQKALNLFLKYAWALGMIPVPPPHCPFDSVVLAALPDSAKCGKCRNWTLMDSMACYEMWVAAAKSQMQLCPTCTTLSDWEHCTWMRRRG